MTFATAATTTSGMMMNFTSSDSARNARAHNVPNRRRPGRVEDTTQSSADKTAAAEIDKMVQEGRQKDITAFFGSWTQVPSRIGDWEIRVNVRRQDNVPVSRTVVALPLTVRARGIFQQGCLATLKNAGFTPKDADRYYKHAWKKKYVWVDSVISAVKEMIDAFQNVSVLDSYEIAGDPRRLAATVMVPRNPYLTSHAHFLVAVDMARCIVKVRQDGEDADLEATDDMPHGKPETNTSHMVMA